ncbi:Apl1 [Kluyveromyces lactis]|nr:Apl1 [Kluyveromyces lactis]
MSESKIFYKYKAHEIRGELVSDSGKARGSSKRKLCLRKIIANLIMGNYHEMAQLFVDVLQIWNSENDLEIKRMCHQYFCTLAPSKPDQLRMALPIILQDLLSNSEELCILSLRTITSIDEPEYIQEGFQHVKKLIMTTSKISIQLRKAAIYSLIKMDQLDHTKVLELYYFLMDMLDYGKEEPTILVAAVTVLHEIHVSNPDMNPLQLTQNICFNLLEVLGKINEWDIAILFDILTTAYLPKTHSEAHHLIDLSVPKLHNLNSSVVLNALKFIIYLTNYVDYIEERLVRKFSSSLTSLLNKPPEIQFLVLRNVILLLLSRDSPLIHLEPSNFFIEYSDPTYIKDTKLEILYLLANEENTSQILDELKGQATDIDIQMSKKSIRAIGNLAVKYPHSARYSVDVLLELLEFGVDYIVQEVVSMLKNVLRKYPNQFDFVVPLLPQYSDSIQDSESKCAMIWIVTNHSNQLEDPIGVFRKYSDNFSTEGLEVQLLLLNSAVKFFCREQSKETEQLCLKLLSGATEINDNPDLRDNAYMYWRLLSLAGNSSEPLFNNDVVRDIIDGELPVIEINTKLDPIVREELELNIGSILSVYLKPVSQVFRGVSPKRLLESPALNHEKSSLSIINDSISNNSTGSFHGSDTTRRSSSPIKKMTDFDRPAETVNQLKDKRKSSISLSATKLARKPSMLARKLSMRKPFQ